VQPAQLSLLPDQVPAPPPTLLAQLPGPPIAEAVTLLASLIAKASLRADPTEKAQVSGDE
jgi:hypothetical protein